MPRRTTFLVAAFSLLAAGAPVRAADDRPVRGPDIDVVICLDVSGSMQGPFASVKLKLWDVIKDLGKIKPTPNLRVGLYSYGHSTYDRKAGWVRKEIDLTNDLDGVYKKLNALTIRGGEEYVARVCRDAIRDQKWSRDKLALRVIFVCGNEPASQDPVVSLKDVAKIALEKDIIINPIFCGPADHPESADWKEFANLAKGRFASIDHKRRGGVAPTPQDKEIAHLSEELSSTYLAYGKEGADKAQNQRAQDMNAARYGYDTAANRGVAKASGVYRNESWDLVDRLKNDPRFDVKKVPEEELSAELRKMKPAEREQYVRDMLAKREALQKQIFEINQKREAFLRAEMKEQPSPSDREFYGALRGALREQAAARGITIPD